jgi:transcriptional regulator with XRE-family HTH domain
MSANVSLRELGSELGVAASSVWRWESGANFPRERHARGYLAALERLKALGEDGT